MISYSFTPPILFQDKKSIVPIFIPFLGCEVRCIYCAQVEQTGTAVKDISSVLASLESILIEKEKNTTQPIEVAFYGGTFTALPECVQLQCLEQVAPWKKKGVVASIRCSTRPDAVSEELLWKLQNAGLDTVELGIQSFTSSVLEKSLRGYSGSIAKEACQLVKKTGLQLGIQLMQGLPGHTLDSMAEDVLATVQQKPACVRLYPCLVFAKTELADLWEKKRYAPLGLEEAVSFLGWACGMLEDNAIPVIRIGVAPEPAAIAAVLAGPYHPSLGNMVRGNILYERIKDFLQTISEEIQLVKAPKQFQGEFWGHKSILKKEYAKLGIFSVAWENRDDFLFICKS